MTQTVWELQALAKETQDAALAVGWLNAGIELEQDILRNVADAQDDVLVTFFRQQSRRSDIVKSFHQPVDIIPASLHPAD